MYFILNHITSQKFFLRKKLDERIVFFFVIFAFQLLCTGFICQFAGAD